MNLIFAVKKMMNINIPNNIVLTWKNKNIPENIINNIRNLNIDKNILFFTDDDILDFLKTEYGNQFVDYFNTIKYGYNKSDFFRYCYLYKYGGYYCDIDIEHILPISQYIKNSTEFFTVISQIAHGHIFQALLYTKPEHSILKDCIDDMLKFGPNPPITQNYVGHTTTCMYNNVQKYLKIKPRHGYFIDTNIQLAQEIIYNKRHLCIYDNIPIAFSRYQNYTRKDGFIQ